MSGYLTGNQLSLLRIGVTHVYLMQFVTIPADTTQDIADQIKISWKFLNDIFLYIHLANILVIVLCLMYKTICQVICVLPPVLQVLEKKPQVSSVQQGFPNTTYTMEGYKH